PGAGRLRRRDGHDGRRPQVPGQPGLGPPAQAAAGRHRKTAPRPGGRRRPALAAEADRIRAAVADAPDATLAELKARLGLAVSLASLWRAVAALGLTVKKKSTGRPSRTART